MKANWAAIGGIVAAMMTAPAQARDGTVILETRQSADHGRYLVDGEGRSVYLFTKDRQGTADMAGESDCYEACATAWPPLIVDAPPEAAEGADPGLVSTIKRKDGALQASYNGWPLYRWVGDRGKGEASGQDVKQFGGEWYLVSPQGGPAASEGARAEAAPAENPFDALALNGPECIRYDAERDRYLISNISGDMREADGDGFISRVDADGLSELKWISGGKNGVTLNAPKGMAISGDRIYVADIDHVRTFDAETGAPAGDVAIEGAEFLNDVAIAPNGNLYVTDTGTKDVPGAVYEITPGGEVRAIAEGRDLDRPNGIDVDGQGHLIVATYGADEVLTLSTEGEILETRKLGAGKLDGVVAREDGSVLVSSWDGEHIVRLDPDGTSETVLTGVKTPAAFDVDEKRGRLLVPEVQENRIAVAPLAAN